MTSFQLQVTDVETGATAEVRFSESECEALNLQMARCLICGGVDSFAQWLGLAFGSLLPTVVDYDLRPPSEAQVKFATAIARALGIALPPEILRYRGEMHAFISLHKDAFDTRQKRRSPPPAQMVPRGNAPAETAE